MKKLNIGCEFDYREGWVNLDINKQTPADVYHDVNNKFPFKPDTFSEVYAGHVIEHVDDPYFFMKEIWRVCKPNAKVIIRAPYANSSIAWSEFSHKRPGLSYFSFGEWWTNKELYPLFKVTKRRINFTRINMQWMNIFINPIINLIPTIYERMFSFWLPSSEIEFQMEVVKK